MNTSLITKNRWVTEPMALNLLAVLCVSAEIPQLREPDSHRSLHPAKVKAVILKSEKLHPKPPVEGRDRYPVHSDTKNTQTDRPRHTHTHCLHAACQFTG